MTVENPEPELISVPPAPPRILVASLALNMLLLQILVLFSGTTPGDFWAGHHVAYSLTWFSLSLILAGTLGWVLAGWKSSTQVRTSGAWPALVLSVALALLASLAPGLRWDWLFGFELARYPLGGLELKLVAILLAIAAARVLEPKEILGEDHIDAEPAKTKPGRMLLAPAGLTLLVGASLIFLPNLPAEWHAGIARPGLNVPTDGQSSAQVNRTRAGYELPLSYGGIGPALVDAGAIDPDRLAEHFLRTGDPLSQEQWRILTEGSNSKIEINDSNARFLLDLLWAFGLTNSNPLLLQGPMADGDIGRFASTGGWTLGSKPGAELYSSQEIVVLTPAQQARVEAVAANLYRPCCNNPTSFPDCNHGMAMLGLLELMAAEGASEAEMWQAAKYVNAYWFPAQMAEVARVFEVAEDLSFKQIDGELALGSELFSAAGFRNVHAWLQSNGLLDEGPRSGPSCGI
jgi:hypothetical protein